VTSAAAAPEDAPAGQGFDRLPRRLGVWSATAILVGSAIGSGIFRVPSSVADRVGTVGAIGLVWLVGAVIAVFGALAIAELAAMYPRSGGIYVFLRETYGPVPAFLFGWTELLVIRPSAIGAIAMVFAEYANRFVGVGDTGVRVIAGSAILLLALANVRSVAWGAAVANLSTAGKVAALFGLAALAFFFGDATTGAFGQPVGYEPLSWAGFGLALVSVMWAYDGWADITFVAGEVKEPGRTMPRAIIGGVAIVVAVYLAVNVAYLFLLTVPEMAASRLVAADAATRIFGDVGSAVIAALVMLSTFGALNGVMITGPRIFYAMAEDGLFFRPVAAVHPRWKTPYVAILLAATLGIVYLSYRNFEELADGFVLGIWPFYALAVLGVYLLRRRAPDAPRPYRTVGYPLTPAVFLLAALAMLGNSAVSQPRFTLIGFGIILLGVPVYYAWTSIRGKPAAG
jgi:amino acid transporter